MTTTNSRNEGHHEKTIYHSQKFGFYANRTVSGDCNHRIANGYTDAGPAESKKACKSGNLPVQPQTMGHNLFDVHGEQRWEISQKN